MPTQLFFSNSIESLTRALADAISRHADPFDPLTVIVPNPYLKKWIQLKVAERHGISMNVSFTVLNEGLWKLLDCQYPDPEKPSLLTQQDMQLLLYHAMAAIDPETPNLAIIRRYLYNNDGSRKSDYDRKIIQLSSRLSRYFAEYELYRDDMVSSWMNGAISLDSEMESAQQYLYRTLYAKGGYRDSVLKNRFTLPQFWNRVASRKPETRPRTLIIFGESHLSPFHTKLIFELGRYHFISVYQVNPCSEFWEDVTTPREDRWQRIRSIDIEETGEGSILASDENENPLLKLWGKTGRETIKLLSIVEEAGSREGSCTSEWIAADRPEPATTTLSVVQDHILRRATWNDDSGRIRQDSSIQIASCPELYREAECVYNSILHNLAHDTTLMMTDISVMVPDMAVYAPVLHSVFSREPRLLSYSMIDSTASAESLFADAVLSLIEIATGSFTRAEIFRLVRNPCFYEALNMTLEDVLAWISWADKLNIFRCYNKTSEPDPERNLFTWQQGLLRLRFGRIMDAKSSSVAEGRFLDYRNIVPYSDINTADQRLVDAMCGAIELLHVRTERIRFLETSPSEWINQLHSLIAEFLAIPADKPEEEDVHNSLMEDLERLSILDNIPGNKPESHLSINAIREYITESLSAIPSARGSYLTSGINISALVPKRQIPFRIIYVMGMQEGIFPGTGDISTLNLMTCSRKIGDMTRPDINRYHFLETLLSAREKLYITYISKDLQKDQDFNPNSIIGQLVTYLNNHVINVTFSTLEVPPSGSSINYLHYDPAEAEYSDFLQAATQSIYQPVNYSEQDRLMMLVKLSRRFSLDNEIVKMISSELKNRIPDFSIPPPVENNQAGKESVSLIDLRYFIMNPAESVMRWHLSMQDNETEDSTIYEDEPFFTLYPYNYSFVINSLNYALTTTDGGSLQNYMDRYYRQLRLMSITPDGAFSDIDYAKLHSDVIQRFNEGDSLLDFIRVRKNHLSYHAVAFGSAPSGIMPDKIFPAVPCPVTLNDINYSIELNGSLPLLWKDPETGDSETLVMTGSTRPLIGHLILPFLFYMTAASNYDHDLCNLIGTGPFTVHVSHQRGIASYTYHFSESESRRYLQLVLSGFLDASHFDLLPLQIVSDKKIIQPPDMADEPDEAEQRDYRQSLINLINDDAEKMIPAYRPMALLDLVAPEVPADAYTKVRDRLRTLFKPFTGGVS